MDRVKKALQKLTVKERETNKEILAKIGDGNFAAIDIKKLKGRHDIYRVRQGKIRIIYRLSKNNQIFILTIEKRTDHAY